METDKIIPAFFKAYYEFPDLVKKDKGQFKYAKLGTIMDAVGPVLEKHGLLLYHTEHFSESGIRLLRTHLVETTSQQQLTTESMLIIEEGGRRSALQEYGCSTSYQKRYNIMNLLNLSPEDDNENDGYSHQNRPYNKEQVVGHSSPPATEKQINKIKVLLSQRDLTLKDYFAQKGITNAQQFTIAAASQMIKELEN
jgi:hypothetical protein